MPIDARVQILAVAGEMIATKTFSGRGRDRELNANQSMLLSALEKSDWQRTGQPYTLFYDAPFTLPFLRRNEAAIAITAREAGKGDGEIEF